MAHRNTVFHQLLQLVDRHVFKRIERERFPSQREYRTLNRWQQFGAMMFAQLAGVCSLRDTTRQFGAQVGRLYHMGLRAVKRSTLRMPTETALPNSSRPSLSSITRDAQQLLLKGSCISKTSSTPSTHRWWICAFPCSPGPSSAKPKEASSFTPSWIMMATFRPSCT